MLLNLRSLQGEHEYVEKCYQASRFEADPEVFTVVSPVTLAFDVFKQEGHTFRLVGRVAGTIELICSRCLEPFRLPVDAPFDLRYMPRAANVGEGEIEIQEDELATAFYADEAIDLGALMSEQFHLALPMKALCSDNCRGLCPQCGTNLNTGSCTCTQAWEDPRLAVLRTLFKGDIRN